MPFVLFHTRFRVIAEHETRTVTVLRDADLGLPPVEYGFLEMFCDEPGCDCRRVFFYVVSSQRRDVEAVIAYGWEDRKFYGQRMGDDDPTVIALLKGPVLNVGSPQSKLAPAILNLFQNVLLQDRAYIDRVKEHYRIFRRSIDHKQGAQTPGRRQKRR